MPRWLNLKTIARGKLPPANSRQKTKPSTVLGLYTLLLSKPIYYLKKSSSFFAIIASMSSIMS